MVAVEKYDMPRMLKEWQWLIPKDHTPLFISVLADWVLGAPDGSLWHLSILEGDYTKIAADGNEYNQLNKSDQWLNTTFAADWQIIAARRDLFPTDDQCIGWQIHPLLGGQFQIENLQLFDMYVYQMIMGQFHRQLWSGKP